MEEAEARLELLKKDGAATLGWADELEHGPLVDVVAWHDGSVWRAAVDTRGSGDLTSSAGLCDFKLERQWGVWDEETLLTYAINVYEEGNVVSIVTDAGSHGTHVAGIVAAHHPHHPALDGVAPGAQIVSIKIGDTRLGSMEQTLGLARALRAIKDTGAHVVNMSYGEPTGAHNPAMGRFNELATYLLRETGAIFVSSAGNAGPALSTNGAPGATHPLMLGIGAAVTPSMGEHLYSLRRLHRARPGTAAAAAEDTAAAAAAGLDAALPDVDKQRGPGATPASADAGTSGPVPSAAAAAAAAGGAPAGASTSSSGAIAGAGAAADDRASAINYTWSSRGPGIDGSMPVTLCAPGGAITSVPVWTLQMTQLMNGTSMASPSAAGCIALVFSGLLARGVPLPRVQRLKRSLQATAVPLAGPADCFGAGAGMIQVQSTFTHLLLHHAVSEGLATALRAGKLQAFPVSPAAVSASAAATAASSFGGGEAGAADASASAADAGDADSSAAGSAGAARASPEEPLLEVSVANGGVSPGEASDRGIYLRNPEQSAAASDFAVTVKPVWTDAAPSAAKAAYQTLFALRSRVRHYSRMVYRTGSDGASTAEQEIYYDETAAASTHLQPPIHARDLISHPESLLLMHGGRGFSIHVDARDDGMLPPGSIVHIELAGYTVLPPAALAAAAASPALHDARAAAAAAVPRRASGRSGADASAGAEGGGHSGDGHHARAPLLASPHALDTRAVDSFAADLPELLGAAFTVPITIIKPLPPPVAPPAHAAAATAASSGSGAGAAVGGDDGETAESSSSVTHPGSGGVWSSGAVSLGPGVITRHFLSVPDGAAWAEISVTRVDSGSGAAGSGLASASAGGTGGTASASAQAQTQVQGLADVSPRMLVLHAMSVLRGVSGKFSAAEEYFSLRPGDADSIVLPVAAGSCLEVVLAQFWSSLGPSAAVLRVAFRGVAVGPSAVSLSPLEGPVPINITAELHAVTLRPLAVATGARSYLRPLPATSPLLNGAGAYLPAAWAHYGAGLLHGLPSLKQAGSVLPLPPSRDRLVNGRDAYALTLAYHLQLAAPLSDARLWSGVAHGQLYESPFDSAMLVVLDTKPPALPPAVAGAAVIASGGAAAESSGSSAALPSRTLAYPPYPSVAGVSDAFPESLSLSAGSYLVLLQLRHEDRAALERVVASPAASALVVDAPLGKDAHIPLKIYPSLPDACAERSAFTGSAGRRLALGATARFYVAAPAAADAASGIKNAAFDDGKGKIPLPRDELLGHVLLEDYAHATLLPTGRSRSFVTARPGTGVYAATVKGTDPRTDALRVWARDPAGTPITVRLGAAAGTLPPAPLPASSAEEAAAARTGIQASAGVAALEDAYRAAALALLKTLDPWAPSVTASATPASAAGADGASAAPPAAPQAASAQVTFDALAAELVRGGPFVSHLGFGGSAGGDIASTGAGGLPPLFSAARPAGASAGSAAAAPPGHLKRALQKLEVLRLVLTQRDALARSSAALPAASGSGAGSAPAGTTLLRSGSMMGSEHALLAALAGDRDGAAVNRILATAAALLAHVDAGELANYWGTMHDLAVEDAPLGLSASSSGAKGEGAASVSESAASASSQAPESAQAESSSAADAADPVLASAAHVGAAAAMGAGSSPSGSDHHDASAGWAALAGLSGASTAARLGASSAKELHDAMTAARDAVADALWRAVRIQLRDIGACAFADALPGAAAAADAAAAREVGLAGSAAVEGAGASSLGSGLRLSPLPVALRLMSAYIGKDDPRQQVVQLNAALRGKQWAKALKLLKAVPQGTLAPEVSTRLHAFLLSRLQWVIPVPRAARL